MTTQPLTSTPNPIQLQFGQNEINIESSQIPTISPTLQGIFTNLNRENDELLTYPLRGKIDTLSHAVQKLGRYQNSSIKDKLYGFLRSAFYIGIASGGIFGTAAAASASSGLAILAGVSSYLLCFGIASYYMSRLGITPSQSLLEYTSALWAPIVAPFLPIYEEFSKISLLEADISGQKREIASKMMALETLFKSDLSEVRNHITQELNSLQQPLETTPEIQTTEHDQNEKILQYSTALEELDKAIEFYAHLTTT